MKIQPYGFWTSALNPQHMAAASRRLSEVKVEDGRVYWIEQRPQEKGRMVILCHDQGRVSCLTPEPYAVGNKVNEYGGGSYAVRDGVIYFSNRTDGRWYRKVGETCTPITPDDGAYYADPVFSPSGAWMVLVREKIGEGQSLVGIHLADIRMTVLCQDHDFYASPTFSKNGLLAYIAWKRPGMPWEYTQLSFGHFDEATGAYTQTTDIELPGYQSQPHWVGEDLYFISDHSGWGQLYRYATHRHEKRGSAEALCNAWPTQHDMSLPLWNLGMKTFVPLDEEMIGCLAYHQGQAKLGLLYQGTWKPIPLPFTAFGDHLQYEAGHLYFIAATPFEGMEVHALNLSTQAYTTLSSGEALPLVQGDISVALPVTYPSLDGETVHAFFYPPKNHATVGPEGMRPPLLIMSHGGPTSYTHGGFNTKIQFWTNRGFAVLDVNYRGSTGFGRPYWEALKHRWGDVDVSDCVAGAKYCSAQQWVHPGQLFIRGFSAGGFSTLCALVAYDIFAAAAVYYGIADLTEFTHMTHRFEEGYHEWLLGPYETHQDLYVKRSPIHHVQNINTPVIFFHGAEDPVVPPAQSARMYNALSLRKIPSDYYSFANEGHGFRWAQTIVTCYERELTFYQAAMNMRNKGVAS